MAADRTQPSSGSGSRPGAKVSTETWKGGTVSGLACKCSGTDDKDFLIKRESIVCASCGREIRCVPPIKGVFKAGCECCSSPTVKSTFVLDSTDTYVCTWCGRTR